MHIMGEGESTIQAYRKEMSEPWDERFSDVERQTWLHLWARHGIDTCHVPMWDI